MMSPFGATLGTSRWGMTWVFRALCVALICALTAPGGAQAQSSTAQTGKDGTLARIFMDGTFVIGSDIPYGVMEFYDEAGQAQGIDIDLARQISSKLDADLEIVAMPFDALFGALLAGEVDAVLSAVTITQERQKTMLFSAPYLDAGMVIAVPEGVADIAGEADLTGKRVGVLKGTVGADLMRKSMYVTQELLVSYESNTDRMADLVDRKIDAAIVHFASGSVPKITLIQPPITQSYYGVVTRLEDTALMEEINKTIRDLKRSGELEAIKTKYISVSPG